MRRSAAPIAALSTVAALSFSRGLTYPECAARAVADVIAATGDSNAVVGREHAADLLQRVGRHDQVGGRAALRGHVLLGEPMAVRRHLAHALGAQLPQDAVQDRAALL